MQRRDRQDVLSATGLAASVPAALLPWILASRIAPLYESAGVPLPALTAAWLEFWPLSLLLPLVVLFAWWRLDGHPARGRLTCLASAAGALLVDGISVVAAWMPILHLPALAS